MLNVHCSNRYEHLESRLLDRLGATVGPFGRDTVLVPNAGLRQAVTLALARRQGICSHVEFGFLARWLWGLLGRLRPGETAAESPLDAETLCWCVYAAFGDAAFVGGHPRLRRLLHESDPRDRFEVARQVAARVEQLATYRPDWLARWSAGEADVLGGHPDEAWQAALWRRLSGELGLGSVHPLGPAGALAAALAADGAADIRAAARSDPVHLFLPPTLAPLHLDALRRLATTLDVEVYLLNPCREYWFDLVDPKRLAWLEARGRSAGHEAAGPPILSAWARPTQSMFELLLEADVGVDADGDFAPLGGPSLLHRLHDAVLDLDPLRPGSLSSVADVTPVAPVAPTDRSVELHVCHSLTRELEVLHDRLLGLFSADPSLQPSDVRVAVPDLAAAAPLIDAVFGSVPEERRIPYRVSGRPRSRVDAPARAVLELLSLIASRAHASALFALLSQPIVGRRFQLDDEDALQRVMRWMDEAGMRWGLDAAQRAQLGLPALTSHTFADGFDRLFLGYALPGDDADVSDESHDDGGTRAAAARAFGFVPAGDVEGTTAVELGCFWRFVEAVARWRREAAPARSLAAWGGWLQRLIDECLAPADAEIEATAALRSAVQELVQTVPPSASHEPVPLPVLCAALEERLDDPVRGAMPTGAVTFAVLGALRGLPYPVVAVLGLDDGAFASPARAPEFDLIAAHPRRGDRQRRDDDRNALLDLVLSARHTLHLSHSGRSVRDNGRRPPAAAVSELVDWLVEGLASAPTAEARQAARRRLVVEHPMQPFAPTAFDPAEDVRRRSHAAEFIAVERDAATTAPPSIDAADDESGDPVDAHDLVVAAEAPLFVRPLPPLDESAREIALDALVRFFRNPARALLTVALGLAPALRSEVLADDEPFVADRPTLGALRHRLLAPALAGADQDALAAIARAGPELPSGPIGSAWVARAAAEMVAFARRVRTQMPAAWAPAASGVLEIVVDGERWRVGGEGRPRPDDGLLFWRPAELTAIDRLQAWLHHLWWGAVAGVDAFSPARTRWVALDAMLTLRPADAPRALLADLLRLYRDGLRSPLPFFPRTSWAAVEEGVDRARAVWLPTERRPHAEGADADLRLALRGVSDPLAPPFADVAGRVYGPLIEHVDAAHGE